ncbi:alpha/beta fold hydrolase [Nesterenkonia flava]|uniref:Alpha/beta fold hydrolase n=1 Tax=Nesterenkonia flava TaxID=469799 RepID=A0ABU1FQS1_9MICC|nr:alpha/beta fold hydrolase [Nesterenkonia flava]MDR5710617.1 alpha/beta fold hydrolase [Nesterenkonia flava]
MTSQIPDPSAEPVVPDLAAVLLSPAEAAGAASQEKPILVVGPSLGTSATALWSLAAEHLGSDFTVIGWDLPGHGSSPAAQAPFRVEDLAHAVVGLVERVREELELPREVPQFAAGVSLGGAVTLQLGLTAESPFQGLAALCTAAHIGEPTMWQERAELVERAGTPTMVEGSAKRWFAPGFLERHPQRATSLLHVLQQADRHSYGYACRALGNYDIRDRLQEISLPVLAVAGAHDAVCPPSDLEQVAEGVADGKLVTLDDVAHQAPIEAPAETARILKEFFHG